MKFIIIIRISFDLEVFILMEIYHGSGEIIEFPEVRIGKQQPLIYIIMYIRMT